MKIQTLRKKTESDLNKLLGKSREHLRKLRFDSVNDKLSNYSEIKKIKKEIAKILTILNQKSLIAKQLQKTKANNPKTFNR